jgi:leucyl aminopeptidase
MRLPLLLSALCALCIDCGATDESGDDLGVLRQALSDAPIVETFSGTLARNTTASRGPFAVQPGSRLSVVLSGTGDADLYVRFGSRPSTSVYDCRPYEDTSAEQCLLTVPASATTVYVDVRGYSTTSS